MGDGSEIARSISELLGDEVWRSQDDIQEALFRTVGDFSIDFDVIDNDDYKLEFELEPKRKIYFYNNPLEKTAVGSNTVLSMNSATPSKYFLFNSLSSRLKGEIRLVDDIVNDSKIEDSFFGLKGDVGVGIYYIESAKSRRQLPPTSSDVSPLALSDEEKASISAKNLKKDGFFAKIGNAAGSIFNGLESKIAKLANGLSDEESTEIFFDGLFDPLRLTQKLPFNDEMVATRMKENDILTFSVFGGGGPQITLEKGAAAVKASTFVRIAYQVTVKKLGGGKVLVRPKVYVKKGWDVTPMEVRLRASLGILNLSYVPFRWTFEGAGAHSLETLLEMDLNNPAARDAFNELLNFSLKKTKDIIVSKGSGIKVSEAIKERSKLTKNELDVNLGLIKIARERATEVVKATSFQENGKNQNSWTGRVNIRNYSRFTGFKRTYEVSKSYQSVTRSNLDNTGLVLSDVSTSSQITDENLSRANITTLYDAQTTREELLEMLRYVSYSIGQEGGNVLPASIMSQIDNYYKSNKRGRQTLVVMTKLNRDVLRGALSISPEKMWTLLRELLLQNPDQAIAKAYGRKLYIGTAAQRASLSAQKGNVSWEACAVTPAYNGSTTHLPCRWVWDTISQIGRAFERLVRANNDEDRLAILNGLEAFRGLSPLLNYVIIKAAEAATGQKQYVSYYIRYSPGPGISPHLSTYGETLSRELFTKPYILGELNEITESGRRIKSGKVYFDKNKTDSPLYVSFESQASLAPGQRVSLWLADYRNVLKDIPVATAVANNALPQVINIDSEESLFNYEFALPKEMVTAMTDKTYELQVRIENAQGEPLSEFARFKIRRK